jgi:hypothetical protein
MAETGDSERLRRLLAGRHPCVFISTYEETDALRVVREASVAAGINDVLEMVRLRRLCATRWSRRRRSCLNTDHPAAALVALAGRSDRVVAIMLDLVEHLKDARTMRVLRECVSHFARTGARWF